MREILVIYVARLGDTLLITPVMGHLKNLYPQARLTFLGHKRSIDLVHHLPFVDQVDSISKANAPYRGWFGKKRFDLALIYGQDGALVQYGRRVSRKVICFDQQGIAANKITAVVERPHHLMHAVDERALLLNPLATALDNKGLSFCVSDQEQAWARQFVQTQGWHDRFLVTLKPQSFVDKSYRDWPVSSSIEFCQQFLAQYPHAHFVLLGIKEDQPNLVPMVDALNGKATSVAGQLTIRQTAALMGQSHFYLGVDTGLTHLAGALKIPMVALYHCRHRGRYLAPLSHPQCRVVEHPCSDEMCSASVSMADITSEQVMGAARDVLGMYGVNFFK